ncbi:MAG: TIGR02921 family PEP-CTERM protein [Nodosilinea sp.]
MKTAVHILCHTLFWGWNLCFLLFIYFGILPLIGWPLAVAFAQGDVPLPFLLPLLGLLLVPPVCTVVGWRRLKGHPVLLMRLFYGVEAPLLVLCLLRLFLLRELTPPSTLVLTLGVLAMATFALELVFGYAAYRKELAWFQMASHTLVLIVGLYVGAVLLFYTVPMLCTLLFGLFNLDWWAGLRGLWYQPWDIAAQFSLGLLLFGVSASLFLAMPYVLVNMFTRSWGRILQGFGRQYGWGQGWLVTGSVATLVAVLLLVLSPQPQVLAFEKLATVPVEVSGRQALLRQSPQIRQGLLNAYLFPYRYLSPWNDANSLKTWYESLFALSPDLVQRFQNAHNIMLSPFLYQGDRADVETAATLYANFFDVPIQRGEQEAILHALQSTANRDSVEASLLNINQKVVFLAEQTVAVTPQADWAEVELYERYENNTPTEQEIFYQFSLPESAVVTGLWLGEDGLAERYPFVVSPRGAAQQVYKAEIERSQQQAAEDPALLEQVGPRQYRLRVFPIPPRRSANQPGVTHLWLTYQVMQQDSTWPLPQLAERRNIYWSRKTQRQRPGAAVPNLRADTWLEAALPVQTPAQPTIHTATVDTLEITAAPVASTSVPASRQQRFALVLDTSRSMGDRAKEIQTALQEAQAIAAHNTVDWYLTAFPDRAPQKLASGQAPHLKQIAFYGTLTLGEQIQQFNQLRFAQPSPVKASAADSTAYDAIFVLTDRGNYELETDHLPIPDLGAPLYLVHLGGDFPAAYADALLQALYDSRGGVAADLHEALVRYGQEQHLAGTVMDGYRWQMRPNSGAASASPSSPDLSSSDPSSPDFAPLAARQAIRWLSRSQDATQIAVLDQLHAMAKQQKIVTPYSSMLVLVNDRQRQALAAAEGASSRFDRAIEDGNDDITNPGNPLHDASVPEPSSVVGLLAVGIVLLFGLRRRLA